MIVVVDKIANPKSSNYGMWYVSVAERINQRMEMVYMNKSKKACVEYAKELNEKPIVSNGIEYGAKF